MLASIFGIIGAAVSLADVLHLLIPSHFPHGLNLYSPSLVLLVIYCFGHHTRFSISRFYRAGPEDLTLDISIPTH